MAKQIDPDNVEKTLRALLACIPEGEPDANALQPRRAKRLVSEIRTAIDRLTDFAHAIDPIRQPPMMLDPYQPEVLGRLIGETMLEQPRHKLNTLHEFYGSGVYAIYYNGSHKAYRKISKKDTPTYAGKADPPTPLAATPVDQGAKLAGRLGEHAKSIRAATNLEIADFDCRFLVVKSGLQKAAEDFLLNYFKPVWNQPLCKGFGKHGDDPGTRSNTRSEWDTLHPGRAWAAKDGNKPNEKSQDQIIAEIAAHYERHAPRE